jgi:cytochrome P450
VKAVSRADQVKWTVLEEYWYSALGKKDLPPILAEFSAPSGLIIINDPELVKELYFQKNLHMEKYGKMGRILGKLIGHSILFDRSDDIWAKKRKHLSAAFYKEKLQGMISTIIQITVTTVDKWMDLKEVDISAEATDLITECVLQCVFGTSSDQLGNLDYIQ